MRERMRERSAEGSRLRYRRELLDPDFLRERAELFHVDESVLVRVDFLEDLLDYTLTDAAISTSRVDDVFRQLTEFFSVEFLASVVIIPQPNAFDVVVTDARQIKHCPILLNRNLLCLRFQIVLALHLNQSTHRAVPGEYLVLHRCGLVHGLEGEDVRGVRPGPDDQLDLA